VLGSREAVKYCRAIGEDRIWQQVKTYAAYMRERLQRLPRVRVLDRGPQLGGLVTFTVERSDPKYLVDELLKRKINVVPSYRNFAVIDFDEKGVQWAVRASPHYYNSPNEIDHFTEALAEIISSPKSLL
jgi:selenocysteine lyase/cysteine desulfurase